MPIVGTFEADFSQFSAATRGATADLAKLEGQAKGLETTFASMDADRPLVSMGEAALGASNGFGTLARGVGSADRILAQFGINLTPAVAALREMSLVAGASVAALGLVTTAALALAAAFGGWKIGTWINQLTGLDRVFEHLATRLLGTNEALEVAAHQADVMARASAAAGREVTTFAEAVRILGDASERFGAAINQQRALDGMRTSVAAAQRDFRALSEAQRDNIAFMYEHGKSATELDGIFRLHAGTVQYLLDRNKLLGAQEKVNTELAKTRAAETAKANAEALKQQTADEAAYRDYQNFLGIRFMEDEAARIKQREDEHAASLARMAAEEAAFVGLTIVGQRPAGGGRGLGGTTVFGEGGIVSGGLGGGNSVTVNSQINVVDTQDNLARSIAERISEQVRRGTKFS